MNRLYTVACLLCSIGFVNVSAAQVSVRSSSTQNMVTLSFNTVVLHTAEAQKALAALQTQFAPREAQLQARNNDIETLRKQIDANIDSLSATERASRAESLDRKEKQLQRQAGDFRTDSQSESQLVFQRVGQKVFNFLQTYAQQQGYSAVIDRGSDAAPIVWYAAGNIDITDQLLKAYDAHSGVAGPQPSKTSSANGVGESPGSLPDRPPVHP
jgi:outer membrane protein